jgi:hypothetical protein
MGFFQMNKHKKVALLVAPMLLIGGYIANEAKQEKVFQLDTEGPCDVLGGNCILASGEFKINVYDEQGKTTINSTFPLDSVTLFLVDKTNTPTAYPLQMSDTPYYWFNPTPLRERINAKGETHKLRLIAKIQGGQYISEFYTQTLK